MTEFIPGSLLEKTASHILPFESGETNRRPKLVEDALYGGHQTPLSISSLAIYITLGW